MCLKNRKKISIDQRYRQIKEMICAVYVQQIGCDTQDAVTARAGRSPATILAAFDVGSCLDADQPDRVIGLGIRFTAIEFHSSIANQVGLPIFLGEGDYP